MSGRRSPGAPSPETEFTRPATRTLAAAMVGLALGSGPLILGSFSVFLRPISEEFGWGRAATAGAVTGLMGAAALAAPLWGFLTDRYGARRVVLAQTLAFGFAVAALSQAPGVQWIYFAGFALVGAVMPNMVVYSRGLAGWFERRRGLVFGLLVVALDLAILAAPLMGAFLLAHGSWRPAYAAFGAAALLVAAPAVWAGFKEPHTKAAPGTTPTPLPGVSARVALMSRPFWLLVLAQGLSTVVYSGFSTHLVAFVTGEGVSQPIALAFASALSLGSMSAQVVTGVLFDRFHTPKIALPFAVLAVGGLALAHHTLAAPGLLAAGFLFGLGAGGEMSTTSYFVTRYFGLRNYAQIAAWIAPFKIPLTFAPVLVGMLYDHDGSYDRALWMLEGLLLLSAVLFALLPPYRFGPTTAAASDRAPSGASPARSPAA